MNETATRFAITLAQLNPTVGDVAGNAAKARAARQQARARVPISWCCPSFSLPAIRRKIWS